MKNHGLRGFSLVELLTTIAIIGLMVTVTLPAFQSLGRRNAVRAAVAELRSTFNKARMRSIARGRNSGVRFTRIGSEWVYAYYDDGDGDGIRNDDIASGVDPRVGAVETLFNESHLAVIGLPAPLDIRDPDGDPLLATSSPVQFNRSQICSFSPRGESTSGTMYLTDRRGSLWAVRVYGATAKIRSLRYDFGSRKWSDR